MVENTHTVLYDSDDPENQVQWSRVTLGDADEKLPSTPASSYYWRPWSNKRSREPSPNMETAALRPQPQSRARRLSANRNLSNAMEEGVSDIDELVKGLVF